MTSKSERALAEEKKELEEWLKCTQNIALIHEFVIRIRESRNETKADEEDEKKKSNLHRNAQQVAPQSTKRPDRVNQIKEGLMESGFDMKVATITRCTQKFKSYKRKNKVGKLP